MIGVRAKAGLLSAEFLQTAPGAPRCRAVAGRLAAELSRTNLFNLGAGIRAALAVKGNVNGRARSI
jgi:hypothetical protein